jgi:hypothetical protein
MDTFWGTSLWQMLHLLTLNMPDKINISLLELYYNFFDNLIHIIPCEVCSTEYKSLLNNYPMRGLIYKKEDFILWGIYIHNQVNKRLGKKKYSLREVENIFNNKNYKRQLYNNLHIMSELVYNKHNFQFYKYYFIHLMQLSSIHSDDKIRTFLNDFFNHSLNYINYGDLTFDKYQKWCKNFIMSLKAWENYIV